MNIDKLTNEYNEYLKKIITHIQHICTNNPIEICATYSYMLKNGYLSYLNKFYFTSPTYESIDNLGFSIITGEGLCRNINGGLTDILNILNYHSKLLLLNIKQEDYNSLALESYTVKRSETNSLKRSLLIKTLQKLLQINHMITTALYQKNIIFLDASSDSLFAYLNKEYITTLGLEQNKLKITYLDQPISYKKWTLDQKQLIQTYQNQEKLCIQNQDYFAQFSKEQQEFQQQFYNEFKLLLNK